MNCSEKLKIKMQYKIIAHDNIYDLSDAGIKALQAVLFQHDVDMATGGKRGFIRQEHLPGQAFFSGLWELLEKGVLEQVPEPRLKLIK